MLFPSDARKVTMKMAFDMLNTISNPIICEVGRIRSSLCAESDGHSTLAFLDYVDERNGKLFIKGSKRY